MRCTVPLLLLAACAADPHAFDPDRVARAVTADDPDVAAVVAGNDGFTWALYGELVEGDANLFFSPFSVAAALGMTSAGAAGDTLAQLRDGLHVGLPAEAWHPAFGALVDDLNGEKARGYELAVANRLFGQEGVAWAEPFLATCREDWHAPLQPVDFAGATEEARDAVNGWVADATHDRIPELLGPDVVTADTRLVLANATWFLADWWTRFDPSRTGPAPFTRLDGSEVTVDLMWLALDDDEVGRGRVTGFDGGAVVRLPYEDDEVAAYVVVPDAPDGLPAVEAALDAETFRAWIEPLGGAGVDRHDDAVVALPRFELRWHRSLVPALEALGIADAFDPGRVDLSPMVAGGAPGDLVLADVVHEAWIRVDERGTEAAAATGAVAVTTSAPPRVVADHPFLFVVRDDLTGSLLFVARVTDPTAG